MKIIDDIKDLFFMEWHLQEQSFTSLELADTPFATGGYGRLYHIESKLENRFQDSVSWLIKITSANDAL